MIRGTFVGVISALVLITLVEAGPDLVVNPGSFNPYITSQTIQANSCDLQENCVTGTGSRRLLRFTTETQNIGNAAVVLGNPETNPEYFQYSTCRQRWNRRDIIQSTLYTLEMDTKLTGAAKIGFCLLDSAPSDGGNQAGNFDCSNQGLSPGFSDFYTADIECNWLDITDIPDGRYILAVECNSNRIITEDRYDNNVGILGVEITGNIVNTFSPNPQTTPPPRTNGPAPPPVTTVAPTQAPTSKGSTCSNPITLPINKILRGTTKNSPTLAADEIPDCWQLNPGGGVSWFKVTGTGGILTASLCLPATNFDTMMFLYTTGGDQGSCSLECVASNDDADCSKRYASSITFCTDQGTSYFLAVAGYNDHSGQFAIRLSHATNQEITKARSIGMPC